MSGLRNGEPWPGPGEVMDLPEDEASQMLINGMAVGPDQKHPEADRRAAFRKYQEEQAKADQKAAVEQAKTDQKAAADRADADQKAAEARAEAERKALGVGAPVVTTTKAAN
jgi:hypothetical protein